MLTRIQLLIDLFNRSQNSEIKIFIILGIVLTVLYLVNIILKNILSFQILIEGFRKLKNLIKTRSNKP